jgi:hypothetical protein
MQVPADRVLDRLSDLDTIEHRDVYGAIMRETFCPDQPGVRWGEKSVLEWTKIPVFLDMFPQGQAVLVLRDPRDVLASYREFTIEPPHRYLDAVFACLHCMEWADRVGTTLPADRYTVLRHEDLVTDPNREAARLCRFLDVDLEPQMLDAAAFTNRAGEKQWQPNTAFGDVEANSGITASTANRWRTHLGAFETVFVESVIGDLLERFGYRRSDERISAAELAELWSRIQATPLLHERLAHWFATREGVERYPSDPTNPESWGGAEGGPAAQGIGESAAPRAG